MFQNEDGRGDGSVAEYRLDGGIILAGWDIVLTILSKGICGMSFEDRV